MFEGYFNVLKAFFNLRVSYILDLLAGIFVANSLLLSGFQYASIHSHEKRKDFRFL